MAKFVEGGPEAPDYGLPEVAPGEPLNARLQAHGDLEAFGGGKVLQGPIEAAEGLSQEAFQIAHQAKQRMDQVAVLDAISKLQAKATDLMYDPKTGAITRRGRDAFGMPEQVRDSFQKTADDLSGNLTPEQRVMFQHHAVTIGGHLDRHVQAHVAGELKRYDDETTQAFLQNSQDAARLNYADQDQVDLSVYQQKAALVDYAHANGLPPEWLKLQQAQAASKTYGSVIESMHAAGQDQAAAETFKRYSEAGYFTGAERDKLSALVEHGSRLGEAERIVDGIFNPLPTSGSFDVPKKSEPPQSLNEAVAKARALTEDDPQLQKEAVAQVEREWAVRATSQRMEADRTYQGLSTQLRKGLDFNSLQRLPEWETLPEHDRRELTLLAKSLSSGENGYATQNNKQVVTRFFNLTDEELRNTTAADMDRLSSEVKEPMHDRMLTMWREANRKDKELSYKWSEHDTKELFDKLKGSGVLEHAGNAKTVKDLKGKAAGDKEFAELLESAQDSLNRFVHSQNPPRQPNDEERRKLVNQFVIDRVLQQSKGERYFFGLFGPRLDEPMEDKAERLKRAGILNPNQGPIVRPREASQSPWADYFRQKRAVSENP